MKDEIKTTTRKTTITERRIELDTTAIIQLLVRTGSIMPLGPNTKATVHVSCPSGADWSGMELSMTDFPVIVTITRTENE